MLFTMYDLRGMNIFGRFSTIFHKEDISSGLLKTFLYTNSFWKVVYSKKNKFALFWEQILSL